MRPDQSGRIYIFTVSSSPATYYNTKVVGTVKNYAQISLQTLAG